MYIHIYTSFMYLCIQLLPPNHSIRSRLRHTRSLPLSLEKARWQLAFPSLHAAVWAPGSGTSGKMLSHNVFAQTASCLVKFSPHALRELGRLFWDNGNVQPEWHWTSQQSPREKSNTDKKTKITRRGKNDAFPKRPFSFLVISLQIQNFSPMARESQWLVQDTWKTLSFQNKF